MKLIIITGVSGSGKSSVIKHMEDMGFFCIDNMPPALLTKFAQMFYSENSLFSSNVAVVIDIRGGHMFGELKDALKELKELNYKYELLYLDTSDDVLIKRYKETRRKHPLDSANSERSLFELIVDEKEQLRYLYVKADYVIDTSELTPKELKNKINSIFSLTRNKSSINITVESFGYKFGIPLDADLVFDVRFMPNPFYDERIKELTGNSEKIQNFVMNADYSVEFMDKLVDMIKFLIPYYIEEGKMRLVIAIGCTGGKHRSVTVANKLYETLNSESEYSVSVSHRDIGKQ